MRKNKLPIILLGAGNVGSKFIELALNANDTADNKSEFEFLSITSSAYILENKDGIPRSALEYLAKNPKKLNSVFGAVKKPNDISHTLKQAPDNTCIVDATASDKTTDFLLSCAEKNLRIVLANKKPLTGKMDVFDKLIRAKTGCRATVGAGLPVIPLIKKLTKENIKIHKIEGCFSGSLGILCSKLREGRKFSDTVKFLSETGCMEPDPRQDLCGADTARKILIIARMCGMETKLDNVKAESMYPASMNEMPPDAFMKEISRLDAHYGEKFNAAARNGKTYKYAGIMEYGTCAAILTEFPEDSEIGQIKDADKIAVFETSAGNRIVKGQGAGALCAANDVMTDILELTR